MVSRRPGSKQIHRIFLFLYLVSSRCVAWMAPKLVQAPSSTVYASWKASNTAGEGDHPSAPAVDSALSRLDELRQSGSPNSLLLDAAAAVTQQSCPLLGIKSVGVDYGLVRTGLAATVGYDAKPLGILSHLNDTEVCLEVVRVCQLERATQIVVGLPLHKNGTEAEQTQVTRTFAHQLAAVALSKLGPRVAVYWWDERYTSKFAAALALSQNPNRRLYGTLDADAACIILDHFYSHNGKNAQRIEVEEPTKTECWKQWERFQREEEEAHQRATEHRIGGKSTQRQEAMERARKLETELEQRGALGLSQKQKQKQKKKRQKRGPWLSPEGSQQDVDS